MIRFDHLEIDDPVEVKILQDLNNDKDIVILKEVITFDKTGVCSCVVKYDDTREDKPNPEKDCSPVKLR